MTTATDTVSPSTPDSTPGMFDLILRGQAELDRYMLDDTQSRAVIERLLLMSVLGLALTGVAVGIAGQTLELSPYSMYKDFFVGNPVIWMPLTMVAAFLGALCICLPSFYFYVQLSGIDAPFKLVTAQALRAQATTSVLLLATLPVFLALALASVTFGVVPSSYVFTIGLGLPFIVGLVGIFEVYRSFGRMVEVVEVTHRRRGNFVRRLVLAWGAVYTWVAPVALIRIGQALGSVL